MSKSIGGETLVDISCLRFMSCDAQVMLFLLVNSRAEWQRKDYAIFFSEREFLTWLVNWWSFSPSLLILTISSGWKLFWGNSDPHTQLGARGHAWKSTQPSHFQTSEPMPSIDEYSVEKYYWLIPQEVPTCLNSPSTASSRALMDQLETLSDRVGESYSDFHFHDGLVAIMDTLRATNCLVQEEQPWLLAKSDPVRRDWVLALVFETLRICGLLLQPCVPSLSSKLWKRQNWFKRSRTIQVSFTV